MSERRRRVFAEAFKREAVERAATSGLPIARVAPELGLNETVLRRWIVRCMGWKGRHRVARLMRRAGLRGTAALPRRVRTTDSRHAYPIAPNRLGQRFTAARPNQV